MLTLCGTYQYGAGQKSLASNSVRGQQYVARSSLFLRSVDSAGSPLANVDAAGELLALTQHSQNEKPQAERASSKWRCG